MHQHQHLCANWDLCQNFYDCSDRECAQMDGLPLTIPGLCVPCYLAAVGGGV